MTLAADGTLSTTTGEVFGVIAEDGSTTIDGRTLGFGPDGVVTGGSEGAMAVTLSPANSPARRVAMAILLLLVQAPTPDSGPATVESSVEATPAE